MITYYSVLLILSSAGVRCQYDLKEYAPEHNNYHSYSFAYGVNDARSGDHKHQWEKMEDGYVQGEYGLVEPDGMMRLVQYTAGPKDGFQAKVSKVAVDVAKPEITQGVGLYQQGEHEGARYAPADTTHLDPNQNQYEESNIGNAEPEYVQQDYEQKVYPENDYANQESQQHVIISRALTNRTRTSTRPQKDQNQNSKRKQVVKKNIENEMHALHPGLTGGVDYISNFNLNPLNIHQLNIPEGEKQILQGLSSAQPLVHNPRPFIQNGNSHIIGHQIIPSGAALINHQNVQYAQPLVQRNPNIQQYQPASIQDVQAQQGIESSGAAVINHQNAQYAQPLVQRNPHIQQYQPASIQDVQAQQGIETSGAALINHQTAQYVQPPIQRNPHIQHFHPASVQDVQAQQGIESSSYGDQRLQQALSSIHNHPDINTRLRILHNQHNIHQQFQQHPRIINQQIHNEYTHQTDKEFEQYQQGIRDGTYYQPVTDLYQYQQNIRDGTYGRTNLSKQNHYPIILVDPDGKLGLPFYPSSKDIHHIPHEEFNYEGIPYVEGRRSNTENQTFEEKERERQYLLGLTPGPQFPPPVGYTRETIWQAGDPDADPEPELLTRQLNETCAYIQWNETTPGNEDGRPNIWQAGDYSAQNQEEELIRSANITCENYTTDAMADFSSGYTIIDYCYQCVKNDGSYYAIDENGQKQVPSYLPHKYGLKDDQQDYQQNQQNYETSVEGYAQQNVGDGSQNYDTQGNYQQEAPTRMVIYPNYGYRNDPQSSQYGLNRRRNTKRRAEKVENVTERKRA